jgi:hypothetical protein
MKGETLEEKGKKVEKQFHMTPFPLTFREILK